MNEVAFRTNSVTSDLTDELIESIVPKEEYGELIQKEVKQGVLEYVAGIKFVQNLMNPNRPFAKNLKRYDNPHARRESDLVENSLGRIRVDISNPHILEDMDYFRQSRIRFDTTGKFTQARPSRNPKSQFMVFWLREIERCWNGMVRECDGEWISGNNYYYWNFATIKKALVDEETKRADRVDGCPNLYDGDYLFFHYLEHARNQGMHASCLKARGLGYSFKAGSLLARNFVLGESKKAKRKTNNIALAEVDEYLVKDGVLNKFIDTVDFNGEVTPFPNRRDKKDSMNDKHWVMSYIDAEDLKEKGTRNQVMGVTLKGDPEKARGKRANLIIWEEAGKFKNFLKAWGIARPSVEHNGYAFGLMLAFGTGGTEGAAFDGLKEIFYSPGGYNIFSIHNVFDINANANSKCSFFHSRYLNYEGCMDKNGNSDVVKAMVHIILERVQIKYNSQEGSTLLQHIAENPITPQEAILQVTGTFFPTLEIRNYLEECRVNLDLFLISHKAGELVLGETDNDVKFQEDFNLKPIRKYTPDKSNVKGAVEIFVEPERSQTGKVQPGRYIAGIDPIDADFVTNGSLGSIFIFDTFTDQIVAEYTGRPQLAEEFYEICRRLLIYYNAIANYESNIKGLFGYFKNKNALHLLADTPSYLKDSHSIKATINSNASKGTRGTEGVNNEGLKLQRSWMLNSFVSNDGEDEHKILNLRRIPSLGYLEELEAFNKEGNFDRVSAMGMLMILKKELGNIVRDREEDDNYYEEDDFIRENFDGLHSFSISQMDDLSLFNDKNLERYEL